MVLKSEPYYLWMRVSIGSAELELCFTLSVNFKERFALTDDIPHGFAQAHTGRHVRGRPGSFRHARDLPAVDFTNTTVGR